MHVFNGYRRYRNSYKKGKCVLVRNTGISLGRWSSVARGTKTIGTKLFKGDGFLFKSRKGLPARIQTDAIVTHALTLTTQLGRGNSHAKPSIKPAATRADALRSGRLHDISNIAQRFAGIMVPTAMTDRLWEVVGGGEAFDQADNRLVELSCALLLAHAGLAPCQTFYYREGRALVFPFCFLGREISVGCLAHRGDHGEPVATLMNEEEGKSFG